MTEQNIISAESVSQQAVLAFWMKNGRESRHIVSGRSMLPFIGDGAKVIVRHDLDGIGKGSIIVFRKGRRIVIHRVIGVETTGQKPHFVTKGDASLRTDPPVLPEEVIGKVTALVKEGSNISLDNRLCRFIGYGTAFLSLLVGRIVFKVVFDRED